MKKNVIFLVLDSFMYDKIGKQSYGSSTTPFLDELKNKSIHTTNLYSQGPFTEAGITALFAGNDLLNEGGYMHNLNTKKNHYIDVFHENGYEQFNIFYPYFMYSDETLSKIDHQIFNCDFLYISVYNQRLDYYRNLNETTALTESNYRDIFMQLDITFTSWRNFLNFSDQTKDKYLLIKKALDNYDFEKNMAALSDEYEKYLHDKKAYVHNIFKEQREHALFKIVTMNPGDLINETLINKLLYKDNKWFLAKVSFMQFYYNLINNKISFKCFITSLFQNIKIKRLNGYFKSVVFSLFAGHLNYKYKKNNLANDMPSFYAQIDHSLKVIETRNHDKPFLLTLHPQDLHNMTSYLTFDTNSETILKEEIQTLRKYFKGIKSNFKGSLIYDFSVVYVDLCIKRLFDRLFEMNLLENTVVVITSDHGSSYVNAPIRNQFVNNYHTENYKIPLFIYNNGFSKIINSYHTSKDVLPTIYDICGIDIPKNISGRSLLDENNRSNFAISEYMGGGCPDMSLRPIQFIIRDNFYLLVYSLRLNQDFSEGNIIEIFDLINDPNEEHNLMTSDFKVENVNYLLDRLKKRHSELRKQYNINIDSHI